MESFDRLYWATPYWIWGAKPEIVIKVSVPEGWRLPVIFPKLNWCKSPRLKELFRFTFTARLTIVVDGNRSDMQKSSTPNTTTLIKNSLMYFISAISYPVVSSLMFIVHYSLFILFPLKHFNGNGVSYDTPQQNTADLRQAISEVGSFKSYFPHSIVEKSEG